MAGAALVILFVPLLVGILVLAIVLLALGRRPDPAPSQAAEVARQHALVVNIAAWVVAGLGLVTVAGAGGLALRAVGAGSLAPGVLAGLAPSIAALLFLSVHAAGERTWPRPTGTVRRASLVRREPSATASWLRWATGAWAVALVVALACFAATANGGRSVRAALPDGSVNQAGPYPGWFYGGPLLVGVALVLVATWGVLGLIARRPAVLDADPEHDAASRRLSAHRVLRGVQLALAVTLAGVTGLAGIALANVGHRMLGGSLVAVGILVGVLGLVLAAVPAPVPVPPAVPIPALRTAERP